MSFVPTDFFRMIFAGAAKYHSRESKYKHAETDDLLSRLRGRSRARDPIGRRAALRMGEAHQDLTSILLLRSHLEDWFSQADEAQFVGQSFRSRRAARFHSTRFDAAASYRTKEIVGWLADRDLNVIRPGANDEVSSYRRGY